MPNAVEVDRRRDLPRAYSHLGKSPCPTSGSIFLEVWAVRVDLHSEQLLLPVRISRHAKPEKPSKGYRYAVTFGTFLTGDRSLSPSRDAADRALANLQIVRVNGARSVSEIGVAHGATGTSTFAGNVVTVSGVGGLAPTITVVGFRSQASPTMAPRLGASMIPTVPQVKSA